MEKRFDNLKNILIVRLGAMGDIIHVMPAVINLRRTFPDASLVWLVEDKAQCLVEALPGIDEVIVFPRKKWQTALRHPRKYFTVAAELRAFLRKLREREYDVALDFHGNFRSGLLAYLSNAKTRVGFSKGYCKEANYIFTNVRMKPHQKKMHRIEKYFSLLQGMGITVYYQRPEFSISDNDRRSVDDFISRHHLQEKPVAILHPGTSMFGKFKRWPPENYAMLADRLIKEMNYSVVFTWSEPEYNLVQQILSLMQYHATIACRTASVKQLIALLQRAHLFIGGDTGPTHLASCMGIPTIAIFGPKDPSLYAPYDDNAVVVRKDIPCSPCERRTCDHVTCVSSITPEDVFRAVLELTKAPLPFGVQ
ncbi:MAG: lipopolysaccharide heptosyltransferase II [Candidatus Brocadia sp.]|uniref:lipopolysaccharide heptosyltransferase II n=1 Tax=Candidatus Brocadia fulgida TaxID=380242 RepID=A0A0M2UYQ3_9BACT|nr:MAG: putative heptosyltransferase [Candidatus Brocadia fulgida]UJS20602.1 MAG: lipopolysaccharide heptosyltransferase II [Candidatus Brocadia sp.]